MLSGCLQCLLCRFAAFEPDGQHVQMRGTQAAILPGQCLQHNCMMSVCCSISARTGTGSKGMQASVCCSISARTGTGSKGMQASCGHLVGICSVTS